MSYGQKFLQNPERGEKLLATGDRYLEETNRWGDKICGIYRGEGQNLLEKSSWTPARVRQEVLRAGKSEMIRVLAPTGLAKLRL